MDRTPRLPPMPQAGFIEPPLGHVLLAAVGPSKVQALIRLGRGSAGVTGGYGGLTLEPRPKDVALVGWEGGEPTQVSIPFTLGSKRRPNGGETERNARALEKLAGQGGRYKPPAMVVHGAGAVPHDFTHASHIRWRVEDLQWDLEAERRGGRGRRTWCEGLLVIRQDVRDQTLDRLSSASARNREQREGTRCGSRYIAKDGDSLREIAKRFGFDRQDLAEMKRLNDVRDARAELRAGRVVHLPKRAGTFG